MAVCLFPAEWKDKWITKSAAIDEIEKSSLVKGENMCCYIDSLIYSVVAAIHICNAWFCKSPVLLLTLSLETIQTILAFISFRGKVVADKVQLAKKFIENMLTGKSTTTSYRDALNNVNKMIENKTKEKENNNNSSNNNSYPNNNNYSNNNNNKNNGNNYSYNNNNNRRYNGRGRRRGRYRGRGGYNNRGNRPNVYDQLLEIQQSMYDLKNNSFQEKDNNKNKTGEHKCKRGCQYPGCKN